ncbi:MULTISPECIES: iron uptake transporter deferrochelatase/peroxidase subunit [unclassified Neisseria]|uniref:iron uptake transporter deferrochelatase/peroxidase subunit n=1 Tax=unclassified Neisseria TaxID=2623750 RepID=UPI0010721129|nr:MULTISPECIES: iron uptake transporter deferrochelatase/peroxidase subunit [unclassified Neisseria]MBF0804840.1 deferrochelatase/peroxidase EfeB [Neisseria sp. 19428wB4_WF04]TFU39453.1 deferrochelatase/peroxidase EfeB [Neisseria sp. WF04]
MPDSKQPAQPGKRFLLKTAAVGAAGAATVAGGFMWGEKKGRAYRQAEQPHSAESYPCYGARQAGITTPHQQFGIMAAFDVAVKTAKELEQLLRILTSRIEFLTQGGALNDNDAKLPPIGSGIVGKTIKPDGLTITLGVGASLFDQRFGLSAKKPKHLQEMQKFPNDRLRPEWCDGDISLQICAFTPETCQNALRDIIKNTASYAVARWSIDGFLPKTEPGAAARNLFGFRDGSANPNVQDPETADDVLWTGIASNSLNEPAWAKNGSYQAVRLIRHFVEFWDRTPLQEQEAIFGREKYSGAPLGMKKEHDVPDYTRDPEGNTIPKDSHMRLANPRNPAFLKKHRLFRRPFNYSRGLAKNGQLDVGLVFICYQANLADGFIFVQKLLDFEPLEEYISPFGGGYFFVLPGAEKGSFFGQGLLSG